MLEEKNDSLSEVKNETDGKVESKVPDSQNTEIESNISIDELVETTEELEVIPEVEDSVVSEQVELTPIAEVIEEVVVPETEVTPISDTIEDIG